MSQRRSPLAPPRRPPPRSPLALALGTALLPALLAPPAAWAQVAPGQLAPTPAAAQVAPTGPVPVAPPEPAAGPAAPASAPAARPAQDKPRRITLAYFGERVTGPGARIGYEGTAWARGVNQILVSGSFAGWALLGQSYSLMINLEAGYRATSSVGVFFDTRVGIGYAAVTRPGQVVVGEAGPVKGPDNIANNLVPSVAIGLGYDLFKRTRAPLSFFAQAFGFGRYDTVSPFNVSYAVLFGLGYQLGTWKPRPADLPVDATPPAVAPESLGTGPAEPAPPGSTPSTGPAEPAPPGSRPSAPQGPAETTPASGTSPYAPAPDPTYGPMPYAPLPPYAPPSPPVPAAPSR